MNLFQLNKGMFINKLINFFSRTLKIGHDFEVTCLSKISDRKKRNYPEKTGLLEKKTDNYIATWNTRFIELKDMKLSWY